MGAYLIKRFFLMFPTLLGVALVTFLLIRVIPGDVVELRYSGDRGAVSQDVIDKERARIGLDQPVWKQLATWLVGLAKLKDRLLILLDIEKIVLEDINREPAAR